MTAAPRMDGAPATPTPGVVPVCPLYGSCGGCQYQHLAYDDQLALKTEEIRRLFAALPTEVAPCIPCPAPYGYRSKLTPHFARPRPDREPAIGFLRAGRRQTLDVAACPIATPAVNARLTELRAEVRARWSTYRRGATLLVREAASGVTVDPRDVVTEQVGDLSLRFLAGDFFQNNPLLLPRLHRNNRERRVHERAADQSDKKGCLDDRTPPPARHRRTGVGWVKPCLALKANRSFAARLGAGAIPGRSAERCSAGANDIS